MGECGLGLVLLLSAAFGAGRRTEASHGDAADAIWAVNVSADVGGALVSLSPMLKNVCVYPDIVFADPHTRGPPTQGRSPSFFTAKHLRDTSHERYVGGRSREE